MAIKRYITSGTPRFAMSSYNFRPLAKRASPVNPHGWKNGHVKITNQFIDIPQQVLESNIGTATGSNQNARVRQPHLSRTFSQLALNFPHLWR